MKFGGRTKKTQEFTMMDSLCYHFFTDLECSLCNVDPKKRCVNNMECMRKITPEIVDKKIKEMISVVEK